MRRQRHYLTLALMCAIGCLPDRVSPLAAAAASAAVVRCVGDCDGGGSVTVDEIVTGVNIALGALPLDRCPGFDCARPGVITVDCLIKAVIAALDGCAPPATVSSTPTATATVTPTITPPPENHFVDNGDGTITDTQTGLMWEKKDQSGGAHDVDALFPWSGVCTDQNGVPCREIIGCTLCQPDAAAASTCNAEAAGAVGCSQCPGAAVCQPINGLTTVWQWLNEINSANFAGHNDWRIPTIGRDGGAVQLETIIDTSIAGCASGVPCVAPAFNARCASGCAASDCSCTDVGQYWSATSVAEVLPLPSVWSVLFFRGTIGGADKTSGFFARAVRSLPCGAFLAKFGSQGSGDGQFVFPQAIAVDHSGNVFVADTDNHRIEKFTNTGGFLLQWGGMGTGDGQFDSPHGVAVDGNGNVFVADSGNNRIQKFTSMGALLAKWGSTGSDDGQFNGPAGVAVDPSGNLFVADSGNNRIQKFTNTGVFLTKWGSVGGADGQFAAPVGVAVDGTGHEVFVADKFNHRVQKFTDTGAFVAKWGALGLGEGEFSDLEAITATADGRVLVTDVDRVQVFTSDGTFITEWGSLGNMDGQFNSAIGIAVDAAGNVFVTDENHRVQKFACP